MAAWTHLKKGARRLDRLPGLPLISPRSPAASREFDGSETFETAKSPPPPFRLSSLSAAARPEAGAAARSVLCCAVAGTHFVSQFRARHSPTCLAYRRSWLPISTPPVCADPCVLGSLRLSRLVILAGCPNRKPNTEPLHTPLECSVFCLDTLLGSWGRALLG